MVATHIDPFAPGNSPQHPSNWTPDGEQARRDALAQQSVVLLERAEMLRVKHTLPSEIDRNATVTVEELEHREELVQAYIAGLADPAALTSPIAVFVEDEDTTYRWDEDHGWVPIPPIQDDAGGPNADAGIQEPADAGKAPSGPQDDDPMAAALAALDAIQAK